MIKYLWLKSWQKLFKNSGEDIKERSLIRNLLLPSQISGTQVKDSNSNSEKRDNQHQGVGVSNPGLLLAVISSLLIGYFGPSSKIFHDGEPLVLSII